MPYITLDLTPSITRYSAPETFLGKKIPRKSLTFSFGSLIYEVFSGQIPYSTLNDNQVSMATTNGMSPGSVANINSKLIKKLILNCWSEPNNRPSIVDISEILEELLPSCKKLEFSLKFPLIFVFLNR